jgi:hypothetical protein
LREFEEAGDAMRFLNSDGRVAWKATPRMLTKLADAEQEAIDDMEECPIETATDTEIDRSINLNTKSEFARG